MARRKERVMPISFLEAPRGITHSAKERLFRDVLAALDEAYRLDDVRVYLREYATEDIAQNSSAETEPPRIILFVEGPPLGDIAVKRSMVEKIHAALAKGYDGLTDLSRIAIFINEYPIENAAFGGRLQVDNPDEAEVLRSLERGSA
jgi:phenylpyruvate tautomerase PptA (4-oxalocrotonate tautomerase family)